MLHFIRNDVSWILEIRLQVKLAGRKTGFHVPETKSDISNLMEVEMSTYFLATVGWANTPSEWAVGMFSHLPKGEEIPAYWDKSRGCFMSPNLNQFELETDSNGVITKITQIEGGEGSVESCTYSHEVILEVGKKIPSSIKIQ